VWPNRQHVSATLAQRRMRAPAAAHAPLPTSNSQEQGHSKERTADALRMIRAQAPSGAETPRIKKTEGKKKTSVAWQGSHERLGADPIRTVPAGRLAHEWSARGPKGLRQDVRHDRAAERTRAVKKARNALIPDGGSVCSPP
jgi:hypothetical protein